MNSETPVKLISWAQSSDGGTKKIVLMGENKSVSCIKLDGKLNSPTRWELFLETDDNSKKLSKEDRISIIELLRILEPKDEAEGNFIRLFIADASKKP